MKELPPWTRAEEVEHRHVLEDIANELEGVGQSGAASVTGQLSEHFGKQVVRTSGMEEGMYEEIFGHSSPELWFERQDREQGVEGDEVSTRMNYH